MIWDQEQATARDRDVLADYVAQVMGALDPAAELAPWARREVAASVSHFCLNDWRTFALTEEQLWMAVSRALCALGQVDLGRRVLKALDASGSRTVRCLPLVCDFEAPIGLWQLGATGLLRPASYLSADPFSMWVLDLRRVGDPSGGLLEMRVTDLLRVLLRRLAHLWDAASGKGFVGLVEPVDPVWTAQRPEWLAYARGVLEAEGDARGWREVPRWLRLNLAVPSDRRRRAVDMGRECATTAGTF